MPDTKINALPSGGAAQAGDFLPISRSGVTLEILVGAIVTLAQTGLTFASIGGTAIAAQYVSMVGDSGAGGVKGAVPAPGAGDAAALKFLKADGTWAVPAGSGGISSVGLSTTAAWLTVGSSPLVANGTLTLNPTGGLTANQVLATPNGSTGALAPRVLVAADIPALPQSGITGLTAALALLAPIASPTFTGVPAAPTATIGTNTTQIATTAFVAAAVGASSSGLADPGGNGIVKRTSLGITAVALAADVNTTLGYTAANDALVAHLAGIETVSGAKTFSVSPVVPTASALDNTTKAASTAYADAAVLVEKTRALAAEALLAPLASPALTGNPTAPTQAALNNSTRVSTTAYADAAVAVETTRATTAEALKAPLASPALTGVPTSPTAAGGTNTTQVATTAFVTAAIAAGLLVPTAFSATGNVSATVLYAQVTGSASLITLTVQSSSMVAGQKQRFMRMDTGVGVVSIVDVAGKTFNGQSSWQLNNQWQFADLIWDGTQFTVFAN